MERVTLIVVRPLRRLCVVRTRFQNRILRTAPSAPNASPAPSALPPAWLYAAILSDIAQLPGGWACVKHIDPQTARDLTLVVVSVRTTASTTTQSQTQRSVHGLTAPFSLLFGYVSVIAVDESI